MRILADENCDRIIVSEPRLAGHDVASVGERGPGVPDEEVFALARAENRILLTFDHDFGLIAERATRRPPAVVLLRLESLSPAHRARMVVAALGALGTTIANRFVVIEPEQVRDRPFKA